LRTLPCSEQQHDIFDEIVPGLFVRAGKRRKSFMLTVRVNGRRTRRCIGHYPEIGLAAARQKARDLLAEARPSRSAETPPTLTFDAALETYYRVHGPSQRPQSQAQCRWCLEKFRPFLGQSELTAIRTVQIMPILDAMKPGVRRNSFVYLRGFFNWCYRRGYLDASPIARLKGPGASTPREHVIDDKDLVKIWHAAPETDYGAIIRLCILSGQRIGQWARFRPDYYHPEGKMLVWPAEGMKGGKVHVLPATDRIVDLIERRADLPPWSMPDSRSKERLDQQSGVTGWTHHDLRRTFATKCAELSVPPFVIERILAHAMPRIQATYQRHSWLPEMRAALTLFEEWLLAQ
jgi:integrase